MADYMDLIKTFAGKVKDAADSAGVTEVYAKGAERAKAFGTVTKLSLEVNRELEELSRVYAEIGRLYYEQAKGKPEGFFAPLFQQAEKHCESVRAKQREIDELKAQFLDAPTAAAPDGFDDFDAVVSAAENEASEK